jgi:hypothetical protein
MTRFYLVSVLLKGQKLTSQYCSNNIRPEICTLHDENDQRRFVVHADNARPHA